MKDLNTKDIIKIIPLDKELKERLLSEFDSYDEALKFEIMRVCWDGFHELEEQMIELKHQQFLEEAAQGQRQLGTRLTDDVQEVVEKDFEAILAGKPEEQQELNAIRAQLEELMNKQKL